MLRRTERKVHCYELKITATNVHARPPKLEKLAELWFEAITTYKSFYYPREKQTVAYRIGDAEIDTTNQILTLLVRKCDMNTANAVYSSLPTGQLRVAERFDDEGSDRAAHVVVSLKSKSDYEHAYVCHIEDVPGVGHASIVATLNAYIKNALRFDKERFTFQDPSGARNKKGELLEKPFEPKILLVGELSNSFRSDIENGKIKKITLLTGKLRNPLGGSPYLTEVTRTIEIKVDPKIPKKNRLTEIIEILSGEKKGYEHVKISFDDPNGFPHTVDIDLGVGEEKLYLKSYLVEKISPPMNESSSNIVTYLSNEMKQKILTDGQ